MQQTPGYIPKKTHLKKPANKTHPKNPPQLKSDFVLCATNKETFYRFKCFKPMNNEFIFLQLL